MMVKLDKRELHKVLLSLTAVENASGNTEFYTIHDKLKKQLDEWDEKTNRRYGG